jgi:hypothetical protein
MSGDDSRGGGAQGSHGRRRLPVGHIRAVLARAQANTWVRHVVGVDSTLVFASVCHVSNLCLGPFWLKPIE